VNSRRRFQARSWLESEMVGCSRAPMTLRPGPARSSASKLLVAEERAGWSTSRLGAWHPFRPEWATERKDLPLVGVKATGGWRDTDTLLTCYQQTGEESILRVMDGAKAAECGVG
jgi:hypothetical protein